MISSGTGTDASGAKVRDRDRRSAPYDRLRRVDRT
jgi:hypothetical protein